jgi:hypothetical protein
MTKNLFFMLIGIAAAAIAAVFLVNRDPSAAAKVKCEFAIEDVTRLRVSVSDVARAHVTGNEIDGTVRMPFTFRDNSYLAECVFEHGRFRRVTLNGEVIAGR